jgi:glucose dehydrogenase
MGQITMGVSMKRRNKVLVLVPGLIVLGGLALLFFSGLSPIGALGLVLNTFTSANNPKGGEVVEVRGDAKPASTGAAAADVGTNAQSPDAGSWPNYNRTLTSQRYSPLSQINTQTVRGLKVLCSYDTHVREVFTSAQEQPVAVSGMAQPTTRRTTSFSLARPSGVPRSS